jgi:hypothetical protein
MWLFMYVCYLMGAFTYVLFLFSALQDIFQFVLFGVPRLTFAFLTAIFYLFTQTLTIFFFVGTSSNIREYLQAQPPAASGDDLIARARLIRGAVSGQIYLNILLFLVQVVLGGAVVAGAVPRFVHVVAVVAAFLHFHYVLWREHLAFRDITRVVVAMTEPSRSDPSADAPPNA